MSNDNAVRFLKAMREHDDQMAIVYNLSKSKFASIKKLLNFVRLEDQRAFRAFFADHLIPTLAIFGKDQHASEAVQDVLLAFFETPYMIRYLDIFVNESQEDDRENINTIAWFLSQVALKLRALKRLEDLQDDDLQSIVISISAMKLPYAELLRGHCGNNDTGATPGVAPR